MGKVKEAGGFEPGIREQWLKGMITLEMAYIVPVILTLFFLCVLGLFYYHDKDVAAACAYEAAVVGSTKAREKDEVTDSLVNAVFQERIRGKCILFGSMSVNTMIDKERITVTARAARRGMRLSVEESAAVTKPEEKIRTYRRLGL